jgi:hypothetical protein
MSRNSKARAMLGRVTSENTKRTRVRRHQPSYVSMSGFALPTPLRCVELMELAEGIEPPTL